MKPTEVIVTLYEGHYHFGVAALLNSLIKSGFTGLFRVGYRGTLPMWTNKLIKIKDNEFLVDAFIVSFIYINTDIHFGYYKPTFMKDTLRDLPSAERIYYFDPDIVVIAPWEFYKSWTKCGVSLCLDNCFGFVHRSHPWRADWARLAGMNPNFKSKIDYYVNSGFIGLQRLDEEILDKWIYLTEEYSKGGGNLTLFEKEGNRSFKGDQDLLNAVISTSPNLRISLIGTEGMGFTQPTYLMSHAVDSIKPWKKKFIQHLFHRGKAPDFAEKAYILYANSPVKVYGNAHFAIKKLDAKLSTVLGRLMG